jgi:hypothetical protein
MATRVRLDKSKKKKTSTKKKEFIFQAGDIVLFGGIRHVLNPTGFSETFDYPLQMVEEESGYNVYLITNTGKFSHDHTEPVITLVTRPEPKKKIKKKGWVATKNYGADYHNVTEICTNKNTLLNYLKHNYPNDRSWFCQEIEYEVVE